MAVHSATPATAADPARPAGDPRVPYPVILGEFLAGRTRAEILAAHPGLTSADIDAAFDTAKRDYKAGILTGFEVGGVPLTTAEIAGIRAPDELSERFEQLVHRQKTTGLTPAEAAELNDYFRLNHVLLFAKVAAVQRLNAG